MSKYIPITDIVLKVTINKSLTNYIMSYIIGEEQCEYLKIQSLSDIQMTTLYYFLSNAWANKQELNGKINSWDWEQEEIEFQIINLRRAKNSPGFQKISKFVVYSQHQLTIKLSFRHPI